MNITRKSLIAAISVCAIAVPTLAPAVPVYGQGTWETSLQGRDLDGNLATAEAYYDTTLNITWLADANYVATSEYWINFGADSTVVNANGAITRTMAGPWVDALDINGVTGWRLADLISPTPTCSASGLSSYACNSEIGHLYYVALGNDPSSAAPLNTGLFSNVQNAYWLQTYASYDTARGFSLSSGSIFYTDPDLGSFAWAVHDGDIGAVIPGVPVPAALPLLVSGIGLLVGLSRGSRRARL